MRRRKDGTLRFPYGIANGVLALAILQPPRRFTAEQLAQATTLTRGHVAYCLRSWAERGVVRVVDPAQKTGRVYEVQPGGLRYLYSELREHMVTGAGPAIASRLRLCIITALVGPWRV